MKETMVNGMKFKVWSDTTKKATFAESEDGTVKTLTSGTYISNDLTVRKAIANAYQLPTFRKKAVKATAEKITVIETQKAEQTVEMAEQTHAKEKKDTFEYRNYIISGNERTGIIAIDNHGNFSPKVYKTVEEAKKAVDEDIEYAEKKYTEMEAMEQSKTAENVEETAETNDKFEFYKVETAYEVNYKNKPSEVFKTYSDAEQTAGNDTFIEEIDLITRNDKQAQSHRDKQTLAAETAEIEARCVWYDYNNLKGMVVQDTKRVIKEPETNNRKEVTEKTYYCVTTSFDNKGRVSAAITSTIQAKTIPESTYTNTSRRDIYHDWFETIEEANEFVEETKKA